MDFFFFVNLDGIKYGNVGTQIFKFVRVYQKKLTNLDNDFNAQYLQSVREMKHFEQAAN